MRVSTLFFVSCVLLCVAAAPAAASRHLSQAAGNETAGAAPSYPTVLDAAAAANASGAGAFCSIRAASVARSLASDEFQPRNLLDRRCWLRLPVDVHLCNCTCHTVHVPVLQ